MRRVIYALAILALASPAFADDFDVLRGGEPVGPATFTKWSGFYFGGQVGYSDGQGNFSNATQAPIAYALRNSALEETSNPSQMPVLGTADQTRIGYGGFIGYNTQWQDLTLGLEANIERASISLNAPSSGIARSGFSDGAGNSYTVGIAASGTLTDLNYGTLRARAGWVVGDFMPYGFAGFALGVANINVTASVAGICDSGSTAGCSPFSFSTSSGGNSALLYGFTVGGGLDFALTQNIFLRGEYEYTRFAQFANVLVTVSSARVGAGVKF